MLQTTPLLCPVLVLMCLSSLSSLALLGWLLATLHPAGSYKGHMCTVHRLVDWAAGVQVLHWVVLQAWLEILHNTANAVRARPRLQHMEQFHAPQQQALKPYGWHDSC